MKEAGKQLKEGKKSTSAEARAHALGRDMEVVWGEAKGKLEEGMGELVHVVLLVWLMREGAGAGDEGAATV